MLVNGHRLQFLTTSIKQLLANTVAIAPWSRLQDTYLMNYVSNFVHPDWWFIGPCYVSEGFIACFVWMFAVRIDSIIRWLPEFKKKMITFTYSDLILNKEKCMQLKSNNFNV